MSDGVVADASALVALLIDGGDDGRWTAEAVSGSSLHAPTLAPYEVANVLRRRAATVGEDVAAQAHADLMDLSIEFWPYDLLAPRAWELRRNLSTYDATYVALAELLDLPLVTLDRAIASAPRVRCKVLSRPRA